MMQSGYLMPDEDSETIIIRIHVITYMCSRLGAQVYHIIYNFGVKRKVKFACSVKET